MNLPETLGTHFSLKITALREYLSVAISSGLIIIWKCRKVLSSVSYKFLCGRKYVLLLNNAKYYKNCVDFFMAN